MNLLKEIENNKEIQKQMIPIIYSYLDKRDSILSNDDIEKLKDKLKEIKKNSLNNISNLKEKTLKNLEKNGIKVIFAKTAKDAQEEIKKIIGDEKLIIKSKSNTANEIELNSFLKDRDLVETDLGDFIGVFSKEKGIHPVIPSLHLTPKQITDNIFKIYKVKVDPVPEKIVEFVREKLREKIFSAKVGITGANVVSSEGSIFILENEGNISLVSRVVDKHIVLTSIDKIVATRQEALDIVTAAGIFGCGQDYPSYVSVISGPSKTADIQNKLIVGAQGAKEVYLILLDNKRSEILNSEYKEILRCINCGACVNLCPIYHQIYTKFGGKHFPGPKGIIESFFKESLKDCFKNGIFYCTMCNSCVQNCPVRIDHVKLIKKIKEELVDKKIVLDLNKKMIDNTVKYGNPFGKVEDGKTPKEMYCC
jgi:L-lactate dehydrogenase complex protein LldG